MKLRCGAEKRAPIGTPHTCSKPKGHKGPHKCSVSCGVEWYGATVVKPKPDRYWVFVGDNWSAVQLRDSQPDRHRKTARGIVATFPTIGAGYTTWQDHKQALRRARQICRLLNKGPT
jgi:hypothetical protein